MKKQNNISVFTKQVVNIALAIILCTACNDDTWESTPQVEEGVPVTVQFDFKTSAVDKISTRALEEQEEYQVNDLCLLIFDANNGNIKNHYYYDSEQLAAFGHKNGNEDNPTNGNIKDVKTTSGASYIYGIANVASNELDNNIVSLKKQLENIKNVEELKKIVTTLNNPKNVDRTAASLLMSGTFKSNDANLNDEQKKEGYCIIPTADKSTLSGILNLRRLDSHITFVIKTGENIIDFELKSWQVYNIPANSYLIDREKEKYVNIENAKYGNSGELINYNNETEKQYSFNFYMQENLKKCIDATDGTSLTSYKDREKEYKAPDGRNTGVYKFVEENATYVEIKASMTLKVKPDDEFASGETSSRSADVKYIVHLGGDGNDKDSYKNFDSKRNKKYIYNVTINDVNSIIVEVMSEEDEENSQARPGAEGDVVDSESKIYDLDAHYNCFNIAVTRDEMKEMAIVIESPFSEDAIYNDNPKNGLATTGKNVGDYKWVEFRRANSQYTLAPYRDSSYDKTAIYMHDLKNDFDEWEKDNKRINTFYYTVYINEYYYETPPNGAVWEGVKASDGKTYYWKYFVNQPNRKLYLFLSPNYSKDHDSSYSKAKYVISQKSIQTYYSTEVFNEDKNALGMEHVNETGVPKWGNITESNWSRENGYANANRYFFTTELKNRLGLKWSSYISYSKSLNSTFEYTYDMKDIHAVAECLSRNRDENGNGKIDIEELKWYLPARDQLVSMFLGAKSLPSPLFDDKSISSVTYNDGNNHYITSDAQKIWAEEGCSFGGYSYNGSAAKRLRCVRNLGLDNTHAITQTVATAYEYNADKRIFRMAQLNSLNKRPGKVNTELGFHDNFSDTNRPYEAFQMARECIGTNSSIKWDNLFNLGESHVSKCADYTEGNHKWRAPNQREFMIMFLQNVNNVKDGGTPAFSRTRWKYKTSGKDFDRYFGLNDNLLYLDGGDGSKSIARTIRCVRDVDVDANGNIIND